MPNVSLVSEWLDENKHRKYPFTVTSNFQSNNAYVLKQDVICDALIQLNTINSSQLTSIVVSGNSVDFVFSSVTFTANKSLSLPQYLKVGGNILAIGSLDIPDGLYGFSNLQLEPACVYERWEGVTSLVVNSTSLSGGISFEQGYQFGLNPQAETIQMFAGNDYGIPLNCSVTNVTDDCDVLISRINGAYPNLNGVLSFSQGQGIAIITDPSNHRIFIGYNFLPSEVCPPMPFAESPNTIENSFTLDSTIHGNIITQCNQ